MTLLDRRLQKGMKQKDLAEKLNVGRATISKWETGSITPKVKHIVALAEIFNCTVDDLLTGEQAG